jgi:acyl-CoA synthetase (AMP-forming)/AMP-acid ligase II
VNVAHALERAARYFPDKPAILFEDRCLSYRDLDAAASRTAHGLAARGVGPGDRVALCLPNIPAFAVATRRSRSSAPSRCPSTSC